MAEKIPVGIMSPEAERYFGVLLERIENKIDHILEILPLFDGKIVKLEIRMETLERRLDEMEGSVYVLGKRVEELTAEIKEMHKTLRLVSNNKALFALEKRISNIEQALGPKAS